MSEIKKWKTLEQKYVSRSPFHNFRVDRCELPNGKVMNDYYIVEFTDWVNVVALTEKGDFVLVQQYRYAADQITWEFPGGVIDKEDFNSAHEQRREELAALNAGQRELKEETGFEAASFEYVGKYHPNPALQNNSLHVILAKGCKLVEKQELDPFEIINIKTFTPLEIEKMIVGGQITHACMLASLALAKAVKKF
jgi:ADP-ribose pyrophosphatase